jgi:tRNA(Phe) wybutosine-synthesizing methylase Tyw3
MVLRTDAAWLSLVTPFDIARDFRAQSNCTGSIGFSRLPSPVAKIKFSLGSRHHAAKFINVRDWLRESTGRR